MARALPGPTGPTQGGEVGPRGGMASGLDLLGSQPGIPPAGQLGLSGTQRTGESSRTRPRVLMRTEVCEAHNSAWFLRVPGARGGEEGGSQPHTTARTRNG